MSLIHIFKVNIPFNFILFLVGMLFIQCGYHKASFKGKSLEKMSDLNKAGFSSKALSDLSSYISKNLETTGMMILYDGKIVYKYGDIEEISYIASCRKSVLSMLYGKHIQNGTIGLNQTIGDLGIDDKNGLLPNEKKATVNDIITSRSGVFHVPSNGGYDEKNILKRGSVSPGEYFVYNNWDFNVGGHILEKQTGNSIYQELEDQLAKPLGFQDWNIKNQKKKNNKRKSQFPAYHMYLSTRDMAKIGQLMMNEGAWNGQQIISKDWISKITSTITTADTVNVRYGRTQNSDFQFAYGYMWWLFDHFKGNTDFEGAYTASGYGGQYITVIPKRKLVIAHKTKLKTLVRWGLKNGGVSEHAYWNLLYKIVSGKKYLSEFVQDGYSIEDIIGLINNPDIHDIDKSENSINALGYSYLNKNKIEDALKIFKLNVRLYPNSFNTYDSLGECLLKMGSKQEAIVAYRRSLELNPKNQNAIKVIDKNYGN